MIESTAVRYFRMVTECGSVKQAAASLRIAPSAISRQVQGLEEELSVKLFERGARGMNLTDAGHVLYRYAVENRTQLDGLRSRVEKFDSLRRGQVKIATVEGMLASFLPDFFIELSRDYPGISISVTAVGSRDVAEMVSQNEVDLGLIFGRAPRRDLIELARMRQPVHLIVAPDHPMADKTSCMVKDLAGLRVVVPDPSFGIRQELDKACAQARVHLEVRNETNSLAFAQTIVARTELATFLPRDTAMPSINAGTLVAVPLRDRRLEATQVTLVQLAARNASPSTRLVAERLIQTMKEAED
ncbi:LysR family transcriptional regulator [Tardiphaga sp.]|uniref:LysR family transcriptional regulator n=1 Tax=Tardiphaga sp. TaxID=1926292 RepID=UPI0026218F42|nr:LysR family transcriptional regulator [Tardiphaga sp.]MDB5616780.1 transcriptional regulator, LysR family [Tardiphaga sp.]